MRTQTVYSVLIFLMLGLVSFTGCKVSATDADTTDLTKTALAPAALAAIDDGCDPAAPSIGGGLGNTTDPFLVCSPEQFQLIYMNSNKHFKLAADLDMSAMPWGGFTLLGVIDGNGHKLSNLTYEVADGQSGLIASNYGTIKNLVLENFHIETAEYQLAATLVQNNQSTGVVQNITVINADIQGGNRVGGIIGENCGLLEDSSFTGTIEGHDYVGGLVGLNCSTGVVRNSHFGGTLTPTGDLHGDIAGYNDGGTLTGNW